MKDKELLAMSEIANALGRFDESEQATVQRILAWAGQRYGKSGVSRQAPPTSLASSSGLGHPSPPTAWESVGDLFQAVTPELEYERAITVGYWLQAVREQPGFGGQDVNSTLKDLGYRVGNITDAFNSAMSRKPALVMQISKNGTSKQARKQYKLTQAGIRWVNERLARGGESAPLAEESQG